MYSYGYTCNIRVLQTPLYIYIYIYIYIYAVNIVQYSVKLLPCPRFESETLHVKNFLPEMLDSC